MAIDHAGRVVEVLDEAERADDVEALLGLPAEEVALVDLADLDPALPQEVLDHRGVAGVIEAVRPVPEPSAEIGEDAPGRAADLEEREPLTPGKERRDVVI